MFAFSRNEISEKSFELKNRAGIVPCTVHDVAMDYKKISDMLTLGAPVLVVCSCIRLLTYYHHWNIPILDYLSLSELLMLFIQPILVIAALAMIYVAANLVFVGVVAVLVKTGVITNSKKEQAAEEPATKASKGSKIAGVILGVVLLFMAGIFFNAIWFDYEVIPTIIAHVVIALVVIAAGLKIFPSRAPAESYVAGTIVVLLSASFFYGRYQAHTTEKDPTPLSVVLKDDRVIKTDTDLIYLGKTSSYYFFYNGKKGERQTSIIPADEVKATYLIEK